VNWEQSLSWDPLPTPTAVVNAMQLAGVKRISASENMSLVMRGIRITPEQIEAAGIAIDQGDGESLE
jgi:hypothetical protein